MAQREIIGEVYDSETGEFISYITEDGNGRMFCARGYMGNTELQAAQFCGRSGLQFQFAFGDMPDYDDEPTPTRAESAVFDALIRAMVCEGSL